MLPYIVVGICALVLIAVFIWDRKTAKSDQKRFEELNQTYPDYPTKQQIGPTGHPIRQGDSVSEGPRANAEIDSGLTAEEQATIDSYYDNMKRQENDY